MAVTDFSTQLRGGVTYWAPDRTYRAGSYVVNPYGIPVNAIEGHISGNEYDPSKWTRVDLEFSPREYGVKGDGIADDTSALQAWLDAGGIRLGDMTCRITGALTLSGDNRHFYTDNSILVADTVGITVLNVTGNNCTISVRIDGANKASYGVKGTGSGCIVENCRIENLYSNTNTARGIEYTTSGGVTIRRNTIRSVNSVGDATGGNGNGFARGIALIAANGAAATERSYITNNIISDVIGEEGDAIAILFFDGVANPFLSAKVTIARNEIKNVSRRFIKIQGSDVVIHKNILNYDLTTTPVGGTTAIDLIQSEYITVTDNEINPNLIGGSIAANGTSGASLRGITVRGNIIRQAETKTGAHIYLNYVTDPSVTHNVIRGGGGGILIGSSNHAFVAWNTTFGGVTTERSFQINASNTNAVVRENTNMNPARTDYLQNSGTGAYSVGNYIVTA